MDPTMDGSQLMAVYGIDEKALVALQKLDPDKQTICLQKLQEGVNSGKVRNASAFLIGVVTGPDALGIDEKARAMLQELPKPMQMDLMNRLRSATDIQNPSAWTISAVIKAKKEGKTQGMAGMGGMGGMMGMMGMGGQNLAAQMMFGKMGGPKMGGMGMMARASPYGSSAPQTIGSSVPSDPAALHQVMALIDENARALLAELPEEKQIDLASCLQSKIQTGTCMNPSGWMVKSCIQAKGGGGSNSAGGSSMGMGGNLMGMMGMGSMGGGSPRSATASPTVPQMPQSLPAVMMILDDKAKALLQQLPYEKQVDLCSYLHQKIQTGGINNPSGWMAKSCLSAGASGM
jgi:hypothetical protein